MVENRQGTAIAIILAFPCLTTVSVALRVFSRYLGRTFSWDDGLIVLCWALVMGETVAVYQYTKYSYSGYHIWDVPKQSVEHQITKEKFNMANQFLYHPIMSLVRASVILFLFRIDDTRRSIQIILKSIFLLNLGYMVSTFVANVFQCTPVSYAWNYPKMDKVVDGRTIKGGKCFNQLEFFLACQALSILLDVLLMPIPTAMVWNLQMPRRTKIAVVCIMSMGWIVTGASLARFVVYYYRFSPSNTDRTYNLGYVVSIIEVNLAIITASAPALKALTRRILPRLFPGSYKESSPYSNQKSLRRSHSIARRDNPNSAAAFALRDIHKSNTNSSEDQIIELSIADSVKTSQSENDLEKLVGRDVRY